MRLQDFMTTRSFRTLNSNLRRINIILLAARSQPLKSLNRGSVLTQPLQRR